MSDLVDRLREALDGHYQIDREIGHGGMASVYLATDVRHERSVALKVLDPELSASIGVERFLAEIKVSANLNNAHILPVLDSGVAADLPYYVMPLVEGETLADRLDRQGQLPIDEAPIETQSDW